MSRTTLISLRSRARRIGRIAATAGMVGLAACESSTAPEGSTLNTAEALRDYQVMESVFASKGWAGFAALSGRTPLSKRAAVGSVAALADITDGASSRQFAVNLFRAMTPQAAGAPTFAATAAAVPLLSDSIRGRTMTYDASIGQYRINPARTGAPSNGVRLVLYEVDANDVPVAGREIGYADLIDDGGAAADEVALRLVAVERGVTMLSYRTRVSQTAAQGRILVDGFVTDGASRLNFDIEATGVKHGAETDLDVRFDLTLAPRDFQVTGSVRGVEGDADESGTVEITARHRDQTLAVDITNDGSQLDGEILFNGRTFVTIAGDPRNPTLRGAGGDPLTGQEVLVVLNMMDTVDDVFDLIEELVEPVDNLIALAWLL